MGGLLLLRIHYYLFVQDNLPFQLLLNLLLTIFSHFRCTRNDFHLPGPSYPFANKFLITRCMRNLLQLLLNLLLRSFSHCCIMRNHIHLHAPSFPFAKKFLITFLYEKFHFQLLLDLLFRRFLIDVAWEIISIFMHLLSLSLRSFLATFLYGKSLPYSS